MSQWKQRPRRIEAIETDTERMVIISENQPLPEGVEVVENKVEKGELE